MMAREVLEAVEKLLQFGGHTNPDAPISRKDLQLVLAAVATARRGRVGFGPVWFT
ncbi:hypothetical protein ACNJYA_09550 [Bradyrhizobium sp. DASA03068]|uniref:hypothetical protein n=1 Tax=Bradyrhizobium sp. BLXBL-01 TaxID=3395915 RepID=UPI003F6F5C84